MDIRVNDADVGHEATIGRISDDAVFYLMSRGIPVSYTHLMCIRDRVYVCANVAISFISIFAFTAYNPHVFRYLYRITAVRIYAASAIRKR